MPTNGSKQKPVFAGTDLFTPHTHLNTAVSWAETFANLRVVADSTARTLLTGDARWDGLVVYQQDNGSFWQADSSTGWKRLSTGTVPRFAASRAANQSITTTSTGFNTITFPTIDENIDSFTYNSGTITVPITGRYAISAYVEFDANTTGRRRLDIQKNGVTVTGLNVSAAPNGNAMLTVSTAGVRLTAGDNITIKVIQNSGSALNCVAANVTIEYRGA